MSSPAETPAADETFGLDPWLLAEGLTDRVVIEIDWVVGCKPEPGTVQGLHELLVELGPPGRPVEVLLDDEIPREVWDEAQPENEEHDPVDILVERYADLANEPFDAGSRVERRYALFVPGLGENFGYSTNWPVSRGDETRLVRGVVVDRDLHASYAKRLTSLDRIERLTLIHEFGHQLGLVGNPSHERKHPFHRDHCTSLDCLMASPSKRVYIRNALPALVNVFPRGYCKLCRADIRQAQQVWRRQLAADPDFRAGLVAKRESEVLEHHIRGLWMADEYGRILEEIVAARERGLGGTRLATLEVSALAKVGRVDEALARLADTASPAARAQVGRALVAAGRHEEAVGLFDLHALRRGEEYDFEFSSLVLSDALVGLGRYGEVVDLLGELLSRGHSHLFTPVRVERYRADLLRRAGRLNEAQAMVRRGLRDPETQAAWTDELSAAILEAAGEADEARALRETALAEALEREAKAETDEARRQTAIEVAAAHASLSQPELARAALERAGPTPPSDSTDASEQLFRVKVLARLGDLDGAAELLRKPSLVEARGFGWFDPCGEEELEPMLADARYADVVGHCPRAVRDDPGSAL